MLKVIEGSHLDHGLTNEQVAHIVARYAGATGGSVIVDSFELPEELGVAPCNLHGPATNEPPVSEEEAFYAARGGRPYTSRMCRRAPVFSRYVTVIMGPHGDDPCVLYTAFAGPATPKEPGDIRAALDRTEIATAEYQRLVEQLIQSETFWAEHALSTGDL